jgi:hypothetical protein
MHADLQSPNSSSNSPGVACGDLVRVVASTMREGVRGNGTLWREWDITLACGCEITRPVRYYPGGRRGWGAMHHPQPRTMARPAPLAVRHSHPNTQITDA